MIQCTTASLRGTGWFKKFYKRLKKRKGHSKAIVATARRMLATVFILMTRGCDRVEVKERNTRENLMRMNRMVRELSDVDIESSISKLSDDVREVLLSDKSITNTG